MCGRGYRSWMVTRDETEIAKLETLIILLNRLWFGNPLASGWLDDTLDEHVLDGRVYLGMV